MGKLLTQKYLHKVLSYDPQSGSFAWRIDIPKRIKSGMRAGSANKGKYFIGINGENHAAHRLAWFYVHGAWPDGYVVPRNGDFLDLRLENLSVETRQAASARSAVKANSSSGVKGVSWNTRDRKWVASVHHNYRQFRVGSFDTIEEAKAAYDNAVSNLPSIDKETWIKRRVEVARVSRLRRLFRSTFDSNGNSMWPTFAAFSKDIPNPPTDGSVIVPIDASMPVGPGNFTWAARARYDKRTQEGRKSYTREWRAVNFERCRRNGLRKSYGMELHEYEALHDSQGGLCAICGQKETHTRSGLPISLAVDHDHASGHVRALLCADCNKGIGNFREDANRLRKAADYLEHHAKLALKDDDPKRAA